MAFRLMRCSAAVVLRRTGCAAARMTATCCGRMATAWVTARTTTTAGRMAAAWVTARMRCGSISVRGSRSRAAAVHRSRVMRYRTTMRPTRRASVGATLGAAMSTTESMRRHDATA